MYVNGKKILKGREGLPPQPISRLDYSFSKGDVITVQAKNDAGQKGFCRVIKSDTGATIVSGPSWKAYVPKSLDEWYKPENIGQIYPVTKLNFRRFQGDFW